jgi:YjjW family glycine radical enzyme activase
VTAAGRRGQLLHHPVVIPPGAPVLELAGVVRSSVVDGPGNRYVLFLQGCNFDCTACHNPSTIGRCDACGACVPVCPHGALSFAGPGTIAFDAAACDHCRACLAVCPIHADPAIRVVAVATVLEEIRPTVRFLSGITVSGGEPTTQFEALLALFTAVKADSEMRHLTTLVDSNGTLPVARWRQLLPVLDGAMVDLKAGTESLHRLLTGHPGAPVREAIRFLAAAERLTEVRLLVVEGSPALPENSTPGRRSSPLPPQGSGATDGIPASGTGRPPEPGRRPRDAIERCATTWGRGRI